MRLSKLIGAFLLLGRPPAVFAADTGLLAVTSTGAAGGGQTYSLSLQTLLLLTSLSGAERKARVQAALEIVSLSDRAQHKPGELSGGQQQRVAIARALVSDPTILGCDEPTGDLDRTTAEEILGLLQMLNRGQGKTIIMVTHDPKAADHATRLLNMDKGKLVNGAART